MTGENYPYEAKRRVTALVESMKALIARDPEQEVRGIALAVVDAAMSAVKAAKPDDPVVTATAELLSADHIASGEGHRAADLLVVAQQLDAAIGNPPPPAPSTPRATSRQPCNYPSSERYR
jgi:hypothetical protein